MSEEQESAREPRATRESGVRGLVSSALLVGAVGAILLAGWTLQGNPPPPPAPAAPEVKLGAPVAVEAPPRSAAAAPEEATPTPAVEPEAEPSTAPPPEPRKAPIVKPVDDAGRLAATGGAYTAQLLVACRAETVDRLRAEARGAARLYVLPATVHGNACWRVCWGSYGNAKDAAAAADLPKALRGKERPGAVEIAKVLP